MFKPSFGVTQGNGHHLIGLGVESHVIQVGINMPDLEQAQGIGSLRVLISVQI